MRSYKWVTHDPFVTPMGVFDKLQKDPYPIHKTVFFFFSAKIVLSHYANQIPFSKSQKLLIIFTCRIFLIGLDLISQSPN